MLQITKDSILKAIKKVDDNPGLRNGRESTNYDLVFINKRFPPILILSEAHKILGGDKLTLDDFGNSTEKAFKILEEHGFIVSPKKSKSGMDEIFEEEKGFTYQSFLESCKASNLYISEQLGLRFISSLLTKPFVILTGLAGSGKTKLALAFAQWITSGNYDSFVRKPFSVGEEVKSNRVTYKVSASDYNSVTFTQIESGTKATFSYELIYDWINTIKINKFSLDTPPRVIRDAVEKLTKYSPQLNSFETHLKAASFYLINQKETLVEQKSAICLVPVGADWTNRDSLLGYPNALESKSYIRPESGALQLIIDAINNPDKPHFLILDEMNLSHVERYFADFLSSMESREIINLHSGDVEWDGVPPKIHIPDNLFIIGTVNIDETTYMFSPKVLDRANVIEFRITREELHNFLDVGTKVELRKLSGKGVENSKSFLKLAMDSSLITESTGNLKENLLAFFDELKKLGAEFGYRTAFEIKRFASIVKKLEPNWTEEQIIDAAIMQKLLPKVHGSRRKLEPVLKALGKLCLKGDQKVEEVLQNNSLEDALDYSSYRYPMTLEKISRMQRGLVNNGFTSFAEA